VLPQAQTQLDLRGGPEEDRKKGREGIKGTGRKGKIEVRVGKEDYREDEKGKRSKVSPHNSFQSQHLYDLLNVKVKALSKCYFV